tara:strand:+ start:578 stop:826 length:249 start_codon:yes stop_codon:yes gene_type:complete
MNESDVIMEWEVIKARAEYACFEVFVSQSVIFAKDGLEYSFTTLESMRAFLAGWDAGVSYSPDTIIAYSDFLNRGSNLPDRP